MEPGTRLATLVGSYELDPGRVGRSFIDLHVDAALGALDDAGLGPDAVDGLVCVGDMMSSDPSTCSSPRPGDALGDGCSTLRRVFTSRKKTLPRV